MELQLVFSIKPLHNKFFLCEITAVKLRRLKLYLVPIIYTYLGFCIRIYTNDHLPVHFHISHGELSNKVQLHYDDDTLKLIWKDDGSKTLSKTQKKSMIAFLNEYHEEIVNKWEQVIIFGTKVKSESVYQLKSPSA